VVDGLGIGPHGWDLGLPSRLNLCVESSLLSGRELPVFSQQLILVLRYKLREFEAVAGLAI
jgi:hypothetical protein